MRALLLALVFVAGAFAGCTGDTPKEPRLTDLSQDRAAFEGTGSVEGVVTDEAFNPLGNVSVALLPGTRSASTDAGGSFRFDMVPTGRYRAVFAANGFLDAARVAEVLDGNATRIEVQLRNAPRTDPYHESVPFAGFMECGAALPGLEAYGNGESTSANCVAVEPPAAAQPPTNDRHMFLFDASSNLSSLLVEAQWDHGANAAASRFLVLLEQAGSGGEGGLVHKRVAGSSPLRLEMMPEEILTAGLSAGGALQVRVFVDASAAPGVALQQSFRVEASLFYFAPHDDGFTALP